MLNLSFKNVDFLKKAMDGTWKRHEAISNNIANVNTPGYKKVEVDFESALKAQMGSTEIKLETTNEKHFNLYGDTVEISQTTDGTYSTRRDGNNVNIDVENANLSKNTIMYNALAKQVSSEFTKLKTIIKDGR